MAKSPFAQSVTTRKYRGQSGEVFKEAKERVQTIKQDTDRYIRQNPTKALAIGFVLGLMRRR